MGRAVSGVVKKNIGKEMQVDVIEVPPRVGESDNVGNLRTETAVEVDCPHWLENLTFAAFIVDLEAGA